MNSHGRSRGNFTNFAKNQWISVSFFRYLFSIQKSTKKATEMDPKMNPNRCLGRSRNHVKKHVRKWSNLWRQMGSSFPTNFSRNLKKKGTLKEEGGSFSYHFIFWCFCCATHRILKNSSSISLYFGAFFILETFVFAIPSMRNICFSIFCIIVFLQSNIVLDFQRFKTEFAS